MRKGKGQVKVKSHIFTTYSRNQNCPGLEKKTTETPNRSLILIDGRCYEDIDFLLNIRKIFLIIRPMQQSIGLPHEGRKLSTKG